MHCSKGKYACPECRKEYNHEYHLKHRKPVDGRTLRYGVKELLEKAREYNEKTKDRAFKMTESRAFIEHEIYNGRMVLA
jgi:hypothetical protein